MWNRLMKITCPVILALFVLSACTAPAAEDVNTLKTTIDTLTREKSDLEAELKDSKQAFSTLTSESETLKRENADMKQQLEASHSESPEMSNALLSTAYDVLDALSMNDTGTLATLAHPSEGVRFSPYGHVQPSSDLTFSGTELSSLMSDGKAYTWGAFDGSGHPIHMTYAEYQGAFIYDEDYLNPHIIGINRIIGTGNTLVNITSAYPGTSFVEFHFTGLNPLYEGMDWTSLILVFKEDAGEWKLTGIIHHQWTI